MTRFEFSNYAQITKLEKSEYNAIKKAVFSIFQTLERSGSSRPVAYDTAWAARVPQFDNLDQPAFPQCLQWLRIHQNEDGSWGEGSSRSVHSKILDTFTGVLALLQWKLEKDEERIRKGVEALCKLSETLPKEKTENLAFEMILSALVDDARQFDLHIPYEHYEWFATIGREEVKKVQREILTNKPNQYWTILEAAGKTLDLHPAYYRSQIKRHGLIAGQPSTTAFVLRQARLKGENYVEAEWTLEKLSLENNGGLPHLYPCDNFDIIHGLDLLTKAGINPITNDKHEAARNAIETLAGRWDAQNGVGFSSKWQFSDSDCTKVAASVLKRTLNKQEDMIKATEKLRNDSELAENADLPNGVQTTPCIEPLCPKSTPFLSSVSKYYDFMQAVFEASPDTTLPYTLDEIVKSQNSDGGWGYLGVSSPEETAYVCLAISELIRHSSEILYRVNFLKLVDYIRSAKISNDSLWHWKVCFSSPKVSEAAIIAAKYAVFQIQRLCVMTDAFNEYKIYVDGVSISDETNKVIVQGDALRFDLKTENTEDRKLVWDTVLSTFFNGKGPSTYLQDTIQTSFDFSYLQHPVQLSLEHRTFDVVGILLLFLLDDIVDVFYPEDDIVDKLDDLFYTVLDILEDKNRDPASVPTFDSSDFPFIIEVVFFLQNAIKKNGWNCSNFVKELKNVCDANVLVRKDLCNKIELTVKRFLQIHKISGTLTSCIQQNFMIDGIVGSTDCENLPAYKRFLDSACKATRLVSEAFSVEKDLKLPTLDNFCLRLHHQYKVSIPEAMQMSVKKTNKEILKMHIFRKIIQNDPKYSKYDDLLLRMRYSDIYVDATHVWGILTSRYKCKWVNNITKMEHEEKDVTFVRNVCFTP